jgi:hypothetical protein
MKVAQLVQGKTYQNKRGVRRHLRQITGPSQNYIPNTAFFLEENTNCVDHLPLREFAEWAHREAEPIQLPY